MGFFLWKRKSVAEAGTKQKRYSVRKWNVTDYPTQFCWALTEKKEEEKEEEEEIEEAEYGTKTGHQGRIQFL